MATDPTPDKGTDTNDDSSVIQTLRQQVKELQPLVGENTALKQKLVLHEAGLSNLSEKQVKALAATHEGEWTSELVKTTATDLGFTAGAAQAPPPDPAKLGEQAAQGRVDAAMGGTPPPPEDLTAKIAAAKSPEEVRALMVQSGAYA